MKTRELFIILVAALMVAQSVANAESLDIIWKTNGHNSRPVQSVVFSWNGESLASGGYFHGKVWRVSDGASLVSVGMNDGKVLGVDFSPDGTRLATVGDANRLRVWSVATGQLIFSASAPEIVKTVAYSPDGQSIYLNGIQIVLQRRNATNGSGIASGGPGGYSIRVSTNGQQVLVGGEGVAFLMDVSTSPWQVVQTYGTPGLGTFSVDISPDNTLIGTGGWDGFGRLWRASDGTNLQSLASGTFTRAVRFSRDGKLFITGSDTGIRFWRVADGQLLADYDQETAKIYSLDVSPDNRLFAYGREDGTLVVARMPVVVTETLVQAGQFILRWQGGSGLYQVQSRTNLFTGPWQDTGAPTVATSATNAVAGAAFYRVQSLPNP